jgi:fructokinase
MSKRYRIIAIGEVLWDVFPDGPRFGGAPANFACHAASLGADAAMVSCVGDDDLGAQAIDFLRKRGVDTSAVARSGELSTGTVQVILDAKNSPSYVIDAPVAWDAIEWSDHLGHLAAGADAVCFGTLAQRNEASKESIGRFVRSTAQGALRVFDVNLRQSFYSSDTIRASLEMANFLKLNDEELPVVAEACGIEGSVEQRLRRLFERFDLRLVAMTRGAKGAVIVSPEGVSDCPGIAAQVRDTVGAGDAYAATLVMDVLRGKELDRANRHACRIAAYVCSQSGATPALPAELRT